MSKQKKDSLFMMDDYREYVRSWVKAKGRGEFRRIAQSVKMHTTLVSQVFRGYKCLTEEQASRLCSHMSLTPLETDYLLTLVQIERAGTEDLKAIYQRHLMQIRKQTTELRNRVPDSKVLKESDRAIFYSSWQYSAIRLLTEIEDYQSPDKIASHLDLSISRVKEILTFLVSRGLCSVLPDGRYTRTGKNTHVEAGSPLAIRHHQNWRAKALDFQERMTANDLAFTAPVSLSHKDAPKIRALLADTISEIAKIVENSPAERVVYLGIDWMKM
jgi:uncharacterized protein (TIGR02147 family)